VVGVFSARGRLTSVVDLHAFFGLPPLNHSDKSKIIVVAIDDLEVGLLADEVIDVLTVFKDDLDAALTTHADPQAEFIYGITADMLVVLELNKLLSDNRLIIQEEHT
jgi:purine-binding chemotaxis protein CheW